MNPSIKSYAKFINFEKFEYRNISKPNQTISEKIKNFNFLFFDWKHKTKYMRDLKKIAQNKSFLKENKLSYFYGAYKTSEYAIGIYCIHSIYWHFKKGFFHTFSILTESYIILKISFNVIFMSMISFFILKSLSDPFMFQEYSVKEEEWEKMAKDKEKENYMIHEFSEVKKSQKEKLQKLK